MNIRKFGTKAIRLHDIQRYGDISAEHLDGNKIAYANQASAGHLFLCFPSQDTIVKAYIVEGTPHNRKKLNVIVVGFGTRGGDGDPECSSLEALSKVIPNVRRMNYYEEEVSVKFDLKYSYFDRLHKAIDSLNKEMIKKIMPQVECDFSPPFNSDEVYTWLPKKYLEVIRLDGQQIDALKTALICKPKAPVVVIGSFGTGKTRLLAQLAFQIFEQSAGSARILIVAHHQASADTFVTSYFGKMDDWKAKICRLTAPSYDYDPQYTRFYATAKEIQRLRRFPQIIVTTLSTSLHLQEYVQKTKQYFTHILMDEGAQTREPESVAPLCMAWPDTKIIIAGDHKQV